MSNYAPLYNPNQMVGSLRAMANGIEKHVDVWPDKLPGAEALRSVAGDLEQGLTEVQTLTQSLSHTRAGVRAQTRFEGGKMFQICRALIMHTFQGHESDFGLASPSTRNQSASSGPPEIHQLRVINAGTEFVQLQWRTTGRSSFYEVLQGTNNLPSHMKVVMSATRTRVLIRGLSPGRAYYFSVRAQRLGEIGPECPPIRAVTENSKDGQESVDLEENPS